MNTIYNILWDLRFESKKKKFKTKPNKYKLWKETCDLAIWRIVVIFFAQNRDKNVLITNRCKMKSYIEKKWRQMIKKTTRLSTAAAAAASIHQENGKM